MAREDLRNTSYDENQIYTGGAKDSHGHSTNIRCHIPDNWIGAIAELVASPDWPEFTTPQHFYRDAIFHRMHWASQQPDRRTSPRVKALIGLAQGQASLNYQNMIREGAQGYLDYARKTLTDLAGDGNEQMVRETIKDLEANLDYLAEPWRTQLQREIDTWERRVNGY